MTLLNVERIKLFSTRSPYWCLVTVFALGLLISGVVAGTRKSDTITLADSQGWSLLGLMVAMVMSALAVTTEYRFGTIRNSFLAVPKRGAVLASKTLVLGLISAVTGIVTSLATYFLTLAIAGNENGAMDVETGADWRILLGSGLTFFLAAVIAVSIGTLIRQSAGAIAILLLWPLIIESLFNLFGDFGQKVSAWLPFSAGTRFTQAEQMEFGGENVINSSAPDWFQGILVFGATAVVLWAIALVVLKRRDA